MRLMGSVDFALPQGCGTYVLSAALIFTTATPMIAASIVMANTTAGSSTGAAESALLPNTRCHLSDIDAMDGIAR